MTASEKHLWYALRPLRQRGFHFRKQHPISRTIVDFACLTRRLIVEVDGDVHRSPEHAAQNERRDALANMAIDKGLRPRSTGTSEALILRKFDED